MRNLGKKIKFALGADPKIEKRKDSGKFIPGGYKSVLILYADFELAWAWRFSKSDNNPVQKSEKLAAVERKNIPKILDGCEEFGIPVTWATVGHLFLNSCSRKGGRVHGDIKRLN